MSNERSEKLLHELADGFRNWTDLLLSHDWLVRNDVSLDDLGELSEAIGNAIEFSIEVRRYVVEEIAKRAKERR